jgi:hypothetical protein
MFAQNINNYVFSTNNTSSLALDRNGNAVNMTTGTTQVIAPSTTSAGSGLFNIGFDFYYYGARYTQISVTSNGLLGFGQAVVAGANAFLGGNTRISIMNSTAFTGTSMATSSTGKVHYKVVGAAPNRCLVIEWLNMSINSASPTVDATFQIRLYETTGVVEYVYGNMAIGNLATETFNIGISGPTSAYQMVNTGTQTAGTTTVTNTYPVGPIVDLNSASNGNRRAYTWIPTSANPPTSINFTNIAFNGMTVNWTDNATDEVGYVLFESHDGGITFNYVTQTAANVTSYNASGLNINTNYIWRVYVLRESLGTPLQGNQNTSAVAPMLSGVYPVGNSAPTYQKLTQVAAALNSSVISGNVIFEMQADYDGTTGETFPIVFNQFQRLGNFYVIIRPAAGAPTLTTSGDPGTTNPLIQLNGVDSIAFDGRAGGTGNTIGWLFRNTRTATTVGSAFVFQNDAVADTLRYLRIETQNTVVGQATINFSTSTGTLGNSFNVIANNDIRDRSDVTGVPHSAINSSGTTAAPNNNNKIVANTIRNFTVNGIRLTSNSNNWTIGGMTAAEGNNIYQEAARSTAFTSIGISAGNNFIVGYNNIYQTAGVNTAAMIGISVIGSGNGHSIFNNNIGGSNPSRTGTAMVSSASSTSSGIIVTAGTTTPTNVYNNRISNWGVNSTGTAGTATGISITAGTVLVGTLGGNTVGGAAVTGVASDTVRTSNDNGWITITGGTNAIIENNLVSNGSYYRATTDRHAGIYVSGGTNTIARNNVVRALKGNSTGASTSLLNTVGIYIDIANATVEGNIVDDIWSFESTASAPSVAGIYWNSASGFLRKNQITNIRSTGTQTGTNAPVVHGILIATGAPEISNNRIAIGMNCGGEVIVSGITERSTSNPGATIFFNSVYVTGATATGTNVSFGYLRSVTAATSLRNNLFFNDRTGGGGNFAIGNIAATPSTNWTASTSNYNYFVTTNSAEVGVWGTTINSIGQWRAASLGDNNTGANTAAALPAATLFVSPLTGNLKINPAYYLTPSDLESKGTTVSVTTDFEGDVRPGPVGSVNGGGAAPDIGADEFDGTPISLDAGIQSLVRPQTSGCRTNCEVVRVRLHNYSAVALNLAVNPVTINSSVTGPNPATFSTLTINSGTIPGLGNLDTAVTLCYDMTAAGSYVFRAYATLVGDGSASNDTLSPVTINLTGGTALATTNMGRICLGDSTSLTVSGFTTGGTIQWQSSPDGINWSNISTATSATYFASPADTMFYRAMICGMHASAMDTIFPQDVLPPVTTNATRCGSGQVTLTASGSGTLNWYSQATGGSPVFSGTTFTTTVTVTDTFYVENSAGGNGGNVGPLSNAIGTGLMSTAPQWLFFDVYSPCVLQSVVVYPGAAGTASLDLYNNAAQLITSTLMTFTSAQVNTPVTITLNWNLVPGTQYQLRRGGTVSLYRNDAGAVYPYTLPGVLSITGNTFSTTYYYWAYNWTVIAGCASSRTMSIATVTPAPAISGAVSDADVCAGDSATLSVSSANNGYNYTWTPSTALSTATGDTTVAGNGTPGQYTYYVSALDPNTGCYIQDTVAYEVHMIPVVTASTSLDTICARDSVTLLAAQPQSTFTVGTGAVFNTTTTYTCIYGNFYEGAHHQVLYLASELTAAGMTQGFINAMSFQITNMGTSTDTLMDFYIAMKPTNLTSLAGWETGLSTVYSVPFQPLAQGINTHNFQTPFYWDGVSNIIFESCFNNNTNSAVSEFTQNVIMRHSNTAFNSVLYYRVDNSTTVCTSPGTPTTSVMRPTVQFQMSYPSWTYGWTPTASITNPNTQNPVAMPTSSTTYIVTVTDTTSGCFAMDTTSVFVLPTPNPNFGPDTIICSNTPLLLDGTNGPSYTYLWQDSSMTQTFTVSSFGIYHVYVLDTANGCDASDTILVGVNAAPSFSLGSDVTVCSGTQVTFSGPGGQFDYDWTPTNDSTQSITTGNSGTYVLTVTDQNNLCFESDTVALNANPLPPVTLGNDTAICSANVPVTLTAPAGNFTYQWSDTTSTSMTLNVTQSGTYYVTVTDTATGCFDTDTTMITVNASPAVSLGSDTTFCSASGPITFVATPGAFDYTWQDQSTNASYTTNTSETIYVTLTDTVNGCEASDTVNVTVNASPVVVLSDTTMCATSYVVSGPSGPSYSYSWSVSPSNTQSVTILSPGGPVSLTVTDTNTGCASSDAATINVNAPPTVTFAMQATACTTDPAFALTGAPAGGTFSGPGVTGNMFSPSIGAGSYSITYNYTDANGCSGSANDMIVVDGCVGIEEPLVAAGMNVFPNPNNGMFTLTIKDADYSELSVELMSLEGKVISSDMTSNVKGDYTKQLDLTGQANGIYFLRVTANGQTFMQKIVKQD